ncbi:hypothetical protein TWF132_007228 [Orbilia oligospora]|nr:hypothetical protein TWF132_007228 [Orbilia oligospora]
MARFTMEPYTPPKTAVVLTKPHLSKMEKLEEKAISAVRRIKRIRIATSSSSSSSSSASSITNANVPAKKSILQNPTSSTHSPSSPSRSRDILLKSPNHLRNLVHRRQKSSSSTSSSSSSSSSSSNSSQTPNNTAAHKVLFVPELLEVILTYVPSLQVLTSIRQVHPLFKDLVHTSPVLAWQTWTSKSSTPPRRIHHTTPSTPGLGLYTISNSIDKPSTSHPRNPSSSSPRTISPNGSSSSSSSSGVNIDRTRDLEICTLLLPILSKWWKTIARNTANYRFFQVDSCVYNRFFPPDLLKSINFTRPAIHVDDLILSFTSTYAFLSYGCTHNITLEDQNRDREHNNPATTTPSSSDIDDDDVLPPCNGSNNSDNQTNCSEEMILQQQQDMSVTIEKLLRMMWIPLSETLRRSRDEKFLKLSGLKYTRTMTVTVKARDVDYSNGKGGRGEERGVVELHLECMEPYDVSIERLF